MSVADTSQLEVELADLLRTSCPTTGPGAVIGIFESGNLVASAVRGEALVEHHRQLTIESVFDIASVSKQMTCAVSLLLARDQQFDLDADTRELVPELDVSVPITYRDCLHHVAGLPDYLAVHEAAGGFLGDLAGDGFTTLLRRITELDYQPRTRVRYSNTGYVLTALAMSRATGQSFPHLLSDRIFVPLGMTKTQERDAMGLVLPNLAFSYTTTKAGELRRAEMPLVQFGDGAVQTTLTDLGRWQGFLVDGRVLGSDIRDQLTVPATLVDGRRTRYGLGLMLGELGGSTVLEHSGGMYGYRSYFLTYPTTGAGVVVLSNSGSVAARVLAWDALSLTTQLSDPDRNADIPDVAGTWYSPQSGELVTLSGGPGVGLTASNGFSAIVMGQVAPGIWSDRTRYLTLHVGGRSLLAEDRLGERTSLLRLDSSSTTSTAWVGRFTHHLLADDVEIAVDDGSLLLTCGRRGPLQLTFVGRHGNTEVFSDGEVTLALGTELDSGTIDLTFEGQLLRCVRRVTSSV